MSGTQADEALVRAVRLALTQGRRAMDELGWTVANIKAEENLDTLAARLTAARAGIEVLVADIELLLLHAHAVAEGLPILADDAKTQE